ncbi:hypothetical protein GCM10011352_25020 [Marinobacterium zhoushanense]|uniref:EAL domain-containing protein n=1 Tax=Marinobacterium zhoushanense TaxID=1679163 RepID=A0ABQ1KJ05_9GAMM|nr:EAL domain-containing protein [Marinobacterium zhoushanense]GGB97905.1 hypothetical protein GCM10011352_25020 [Marinobacterium zhoushanense]
MPNISCAHCADGSALDIGFSMAFQPIVDLHDRSPARQAIVRAIVSLCQELDIGPLAEGVETRDELRCLSDLGIYLYQGYYFAKPAFESLAEVPEDRFDI